jgi:hypothetical protein
LTASRGPGGGATTLFFGRNCVEMGRDQVGQMNLDDVFIRPWCCFRV